MGFTSSLGSALLARSAGVLADIPLPLKESGGVSKWVLEQPLPLSAILLLAGVALWYMLRGQGKEKDALRVGALMVVLAALVFAAGTFIETEPEKLKARARELVAAVAKADSTRVGPMLADNAVAQPWGLSRSVTLSKMESHLGRSITIKEHKIHTLRAAVDGAATGRTQLRVHVVADGALYAGPIGSWWMLRWRKDPGGEWKVVEIEMQQLDGVDVGSIRP